jgi:hypothetical protein
MDGTYGFDDRMDADDNESSQYDGSRSRGLYSDSLISTRGEQGRGRGDGRDIGRRGDGGRDRGRGYR